MYKLNKHQNYMHQQFYLTEQVLFNFFEPEITFLIMEHLPDYNQRKRFRKINKLIGHPRLLTLYWYYEEPVVVGNRRIEFMVKRITKNYAIQCFQILLELEQSSTFIKEAYSYVIDCLKYRKHYHLLVIHNNYIVLEDFKFPIFYRHLNLFL